MRYLFPTIGAALVLSAVGLDAQCVVPPVPKIPVLNIFDAAQEKILGDVLDAEGRSHLRIIEDDQLLEPVRIVGDRLLQAFGLPSDSTRFYLIDLPELDAFTVPGHVYVSRQIVAALRNEDELAALLGHELGHELTHQAAIEMSVRLKAVLDVDKVGDRADITAKYHQLADQWAKNRRAFRKRKELDEEREQYIADEVSLQAALRAGYDPNAAVEFFDRVLDTKGNTGTFWSDIFGTTRPEQKRLRELVRKFSKPPGCAPKGPSIHDFPLWQTAVAEYVTKNRRENIPGLIFKSKLTPAFRAEAKHLQFSPDAKYVLAQDDGAIYVLTREPFTEILQIDAAAANAAQFTPDSRAIVFDNDNKRVERWDLSSRRRVSVRQLVIARGCTSSLLSPDGKYFACFEEGETLAVFDVAASTRVFEKKVNVTPSFADLLTFLLSGAHAFISFSFSPDSHYLLAGGGEVALALDTQSLKPAPLPGSLRSCVGSRHFAFLDNDRVFCINPSDSSKSTVVRYPSGEAETKVAIGLPQRLDRATHGNYAILRPVPKFAVGVFDIAQNKIVVGGQSPALDLYDNLMVAERGSGAIGLYAFPNRQLLAEASLSQGLLGRLDAFSISPDQNSIAISSHTRGGMWDLKTGVRPIYVRGFEDAYVTPFGRLLARFSAQEDLKAPPTLSEIDPANPNQAIQVPLDKELQTTLVERFLVVRRTLKEKETIKGKIYEIQDVSNRKPIWSHTYSRAFPNLSLDPRSETVAISWQLGDNGVKDELKDVPELREKLGRSGKGEGNRLVQIVSIRTGNQLGSILIDAGSGSFTVERIINAGDAVVAFDDKNRALVYSVSSGTLVGHVFGQRSAFSSASHLMAIENQSGEVSVYDLADLSKRGDLSFDGPTAAMAFNPEGTRLFVLTRNQTAYSVAVPNASAANSVTQ